MIGLRVIGIGGMVLFFFALGRGFGTDRYSRARIFVGPLGFVLNIFALLLGAGLMAFGFLFSMVT